MSKRVKQDSTMTRRQIDNEIKRINRQIVQAVKVFGMDSRLYHQYEAILFPKAQNGLAGGLHVKQNKAGIWQISRSKRTLEQVENITAYQKNLKNLGRVQTVAKVKEETLKSYERRTGNKPKSAKEKNVAVKEESRLYKNISDTLNYWLEEMYKVEKERGVTFKNHLEIKKLSGGPWTKTKDMLEMIRLAKEAVENENAETVSNILTGW